MAVHEILRMDDPRLQIFAEPMPARTGTPELDMLIRDLFDTMHAAGGAGLAAPQIGVNLRVVIFGTGEVLTRYPDAAPVPPTVLINPVLEPLGEVQDEDFHGKDA